MTPQVILIKKPGAAGFLTAAKLEKIADSGPGYSIYRWRFFISPTLDPHPETGLEAAVLDEKSGTLYLLAGRA